MTIVGYHASHEQFPPSELLRLTQKAESSGFNAAMCSDHLMPWSQAQGHSGFAWSWLGSALQATSLSFGMVNAPGYRYHPVIVAHAAATLSEMYPERLWVSVGSGEALNEHITGEKWPLKPDRNARLQESVEIMRALWRGDTVTRHGHVTVENARLYSLPERPPRVYGAAISSETAGWLAGWADGLITVNQPMDTLRAVVTAFRENGGADKPMILQIKLSYAEDESVARQEALEQWGPNILSSNIAANLEMPDQFEAAAKTVRPEDMDDAVVISSDPNQHLDRIHEYLGLGFDRVYLHNVNKRQEAFIDAFGRHVLPELIGQQ